MPIIKILKNIITHPLNRRNKIKSILRFVRWQIGSRLLQGDKIHKWVNNSKFIVSNGETGLTGNIYSGLCEFKDMGFLLHFLREEDLFIDVGANVGSYTILASAVIEANSKSFEPIPKTFKRLNDNVRLNYIEEKVSCINKGVGENEGLLFFTKSRDTINHVIPANQNYEDEIEVKVTTLDRSLGNEAPALMKIDVEGFEKSVLKGALNVLKKSSLKAAIIELNDTSNRYGIDESEILEVMFNHDFKTYSYDPMERTLTDLDHQKSKSGNTLFLRDIEYVKNRLESSSKIRIQEAVL